MCYRWDEQKNIFSANRLTDLPLYEAQTRTAYTIHWAIATTALIVAEPNSISAICICFVIGIHFVLPFAHTELSTFPDFPVIKSAENYYCSLQKRPWIAATAI